MSCSLWFTARQFVALALAALMAGCAYTSTRVGATPEDVPIVPLASGEHDDELIPMNLTARLLRPFISGDYPPFTADIPVREGAPLDLKPAAGIDGQVLAMPGHTPGSVVLVLANHTAFVGDLMMGGPLGGLFRPQDPQESYFHADRARNRRNIAQLLALGVETFYLGHGGPVSRKDVAKAFGLALDGVGTP
jgi:glyoxylase-like metal-dependent hydrolase (beta-lactamase superfamily II)